MIASLTNIIITASILYGSSLSDYFEKKASEIINLYPEEKIVCEYDYDTAKELLSNPLGFQEYCLEKSVNVFSNKCPYIADCLLQALEEHKLEKNNNEDYVQFLKNLFITYSTSSLPPPGNIDVKLLEKISNDDEFFEWVINNYKDNYNYLMVSLRKIKNKDFIIIYVKNVLGTYKKPQEQESVDFSEYNAVRDFILNYDKNVHNAILSEDELEFMKNWIYDIEK